MCVRVCSQFTRECFLIDSHIITRVIINTPPMSRTQPTKPDLLHIKTSQKSNTHDCQSATYQKQPQSSSPNQLTQNYPSKPTKSIKIRNIKNRKKKETIWFHSLSMTKKVWQTSFFFYLSWLIITMTIISTTPKWWLPSDNGMSLIFKTYLKL